MYCKVRMVDPSNYTTLPGKARRENIYVRRGDAYTPKAHTIAAMHRQSIAMPVRGALPFT